MIKLNEYQRIEHDGKYYIILCHEIDNFTSSERVMVSNISIDDCIKQINAGKRFVKINKVINNKSDFTNRIFCTIDGVEEEYKYAVVGKVYIDDDMGSEVEMANGIETLIKMNEIEG